MFQKIRNRLLINNIVVFALVLAGSAIAVRTVFVRNLHQQLAAQLTALGQGVVTEAEMDDGALKVEDDFLAQTLINRHQSFEWFDRQGNSVERMGDSFPETPLNPEATVEIVDQDLPIQSVTLPILGDNGKALIGYVRVSQLLDEFEETVLQLDIGLGVGVIVATIFSSAGILWLNRQAMQPIEDSFQRLKQFTADASHELRSPLMAISSNVEVALKYPAGMREEDREVMVSVSSAADQMTHLTEDLLLLARTDQASKMEKIPVNLTEMLKTLVQLYRFQAESRQIELTAALSPDLWLRGDAACLARAFTNLLQNAIRYTPAGGQVSIDARRWGNHLRVKVRDTGAGIAKEHQDKIFERFWRADKTRHYDDGGSGLGLPITQAIVYSHGGTIAVDSSLGGGSCFIVILAAI